MTVEPCVPCNGTGVIPAPCGRYEVERCTSCHGTGVTGANAPPAVPSVVPREQPWSPYEHGDRK